MKFLSYNVQSGGYKSYFSNESPPERLDDIANVVRSTNSDFVTLCDTFNWSKKLSKEKLRKLFGFENIFGVNIGDKVEPNEVEITVMTNLKVSEFSTFEGYDRTFIKTSIEVDAEGAEKDTLEIYSIYLSHRREKNRQKELNAVLEKVDPTVPTIITGDFNTISINSVPFIKKLLGSETKIEEVLVNWGFKNVFGDTVATFPTKIVTSKIPSEIIQLDHAFCSEKIAIENSQVIKNGLCDKASDHYPIFFELTI